MFRDLPSVHQLLSILEPRWPDVGHAGLRDTVREVLERWRDQLRQGVAPPGLEGIVASVELRLDQRQQPTLRPVINASGVIIQTNLGRAPLSVAAQEALVAAAQGYTNLEYDLERGERGSRSVHLSHQLARLTGAEAALVVNNAAAALVLTLGAVARGRDVLISRGQAVEIGGGFRIPEVIEQSGCRLRDVGTTNRTYASDYAAALTPEAGAILRVHRSNFALVGFTHEPSLAELVALARDHGVPLVDDLGSGLLLDVRRWGLPAEPQVQESVAAGADLVIFSGDKLLGGPQAGIIVGRQRWIEQLARQPLLRALRVDKLTIAALSATLRAYERGTACAEIPVWRMINAGLADLRERAVRIQQQLPMLALVAVATAVGGGTLPEATLESLALEYAGSAALAHQLRQASQPVVARIHADRVLFDLRTVLPEQDAQLIEALLAQGLA